MRQTFLAVNCVLLTVLCFSYVLPATVRPYKFGFTIEEQQHRREQRDENGIVMGEFGFITADGIYHVTVYATDEEGKFRIISMKNYPYTGPVAPKSPPPTTTTAASVARHHFNTAACSGCFLNKSPPEATQPEAIRPSTKTEIRPLSQPLSPSAAVGAVPGEFKGHTVTPSTQTHTHSQVAILKESLELAAAAAAQDLQSFVFSPQTEPQAAAAATFFAAAVPAPAAEPVVVRNAKTVALAHEIAKVQALRPARILSASATTTQSKEVPVDAPALSSAVAFVAKLARIPPEAAGAKDFQSFAVQTLRPPSSLKANGPATEPKDLLADAPDPSSAAVQVANLVRMPPKDLQSFVPGHHDAQAAAAIALIRELSKVQTLRPPSSLEANGPATEPKDLLADAPDPSSAAVQVANLVRTPLEANVLHASGSATQPQKLPAPGSAPAFVEKLAGIPPATAGAKDLNRFAFGTLRLISLAAAQRLNGRVLSATQHEAQPVKQAVAGIVQEQKQDNALSPTPPLANHVQSGQQPLSAAGNAAAGALPALTGTQQQAAAGVKPPLADGKSAQQPSGGSSSDSFKPNTVAALPAVTATKQQSQPSSGSTASNNSPQPTSTKTATIVGAVGEPGLTGDLYKFKYILDYNGHEETGSRNGDKVGNYFAIGEDAVERVVEYIANEFGFQPHISWRKLEGKEAALPDENSLKHYEFKWFNKAAQ
ncbi:protein lethal(3)malignant blood neoplasm 1 [Drosophila novamexicana]|uniref:protein lethal(3)malignant blood neoplasm 1 n=1 Tax=Drosophila novamexicana TaxID=47314 RepID=UPI0011E59508|nr:protein lethal(3)malignant blood neoplasm 1 [Drosophila novamexicana]